MKGSYTVEAAFVMTIGLFALLSLLFLAFYLHDFQCLKAELAELADRGAAQGWDKEQLEEEIEEKLQKLQFLFLQVREICVEEDAKEKRLVVKVLPPLHAYVKLFFQDRTEQGMIQVSAKRFCPEQLIRQTEAGKEVFE